ncbi:DUF3558 domain-containing protein [Streptoalloteichus hindustanus]|uniref:DUF3558 domain-containing protein n=1 Tax=Streptoalloteichus hindustanus TaxID=2017 RepID=A0A1M5FI40_STRHI|nr:DUF3558 family protein [Streptoalloteichus hindustanus]SHF90812.1 Protein of unknown function [Streptoalloteichus hindustanus]
MRIRWGRLWGAALAVAACASCTSVVTGSPVGAGGSAAAEQPVDRPAEAVLSALRQLDACALIDPAAATGAGFPNNARAVPTAPHSCEYAADGGAKARVQVGRGFDHSGRYHAEPINLNGVKAYLYRGEKRNETPCEISVPVSFTLSINLEVRLGTGAGGDACAQVKALGAAATTKLGNPDSVTADPAKRTLVNWDGCTLARIVTAQQPNLRRMSSRDALDECQLVEDKKQGGDDTKVEIRYDTDPLQGNQTIRQVGGRNAAITELSGSCWVRWAHGPSGSPEKLHPLTVVTIKGSTCDNTTRTAAEAMRALAGAPPAAPPPQRPLTYRPDEQDDAAAGACVDYISAGSATGCRPHTGARVPSDKKDLIAAANADPNVACSAADETVRQVFGSAMRPVTYGAHCFWGEPTHAITVRVTITGDWAPDQFGQDPKLYANRQKKTFGGAPGVSWNAGKGAYEIYLSTTGDITKPGYLAGEVQVWPPRGAADATPDPSKLPLLDQVMTKLAERYLR